MTTTPGPTVGEQMLAMKRRIAELEDSLAAMDREHEEMISRAVEAEAELAQSQAEVELRGEYAHDLFRELQAERRLLTEARDLLFHDDLHGKSDKPCPGCALEARIDAARSGAQGEEGDGHG